MALTVTKIFNISYGHRLPGYNGSCANSHGHNSQIEVEFSRLPDHEHIEPYPTMVADFSNIKRFVGPLVEGLDHRNLNELFSYPTAETIVSYLASKIIEVYPEIYGKMLSRIRVYETPTSYAEWRKD